LLLERISILE